MYIYQTMSNNFGFIDIILLAMIAGFIILRLRNILGKKMPLENTPKNNLFDDKKFENYKPQKKIKPLSEKGPEGDEKKDFLKGAEIAYETIITAFASGDKKELSKLLTNEMKDSFEQAIDQRKKENIKSELTFVGFKESSIEKFEKAKNEIFTTVKFISEIISVKKDKNNQTIEGNPDRVKTVTDHWKFSKKISSKDPNWLLSEIINK